MLLSILLITTDSHHSLHGMPSERNMAQASVTPHVHRAGQASLSAAAAACRLSRMPEGMKPRPPSRLRSSPQTHLTAELSQPRATPPSQPALGSNLLLLLA